VSFALGSITSDPGVSGSFTNSSGTITTVPPSEIGTSGIFFNEQLDGANDAQPDPVGSISPFEGHDVGFGTTVDVVQFDNLNPGDQYEIAVYSGGTGDADGVQFFDGTAGNNLSFQTSATALNSVAGAQTSFIPVGTAGANFATDTMFAPVDGSLSFAILDSPTDNTSILNGFGIEDLSTAAVPEPSTYMLLGLGGLVLLFLKVRRSRQV
jgi:hypothetical protein